jgi:hypothetical protein
MVAIREQSGNHTNRRQSHTRHPARAKPIIQDNLEGNNYKEESIIDVVTKHFNVNQFGNRATVMQEIVNPPPFPWLMFKEPVQ